MTIQVTFLLFRLEALREAKVILLFHLTGTAMELFKVNACSWTYPEPAFFKLWGVPLFSGFMYASVGSYMARVIRIFDMRFAPYPPFAWTIALAAAICINFFSHQHLPDIQIALFASSILLFWRTCIWYQIGKYDRWMPLPLAALLSGIFLWITENVGTGTGTWIYAGTTGLDWVSFAKMGSWYLLLYVSSATVTLIYRDALYHQSITGNRATKAPRSTGHPMSEG